VTDIDLVALIRKAAAEALNAQAEVAQKATKARAPRVTGALVESIKTADASPNSLVSQVYSNADHALYQHEALDLVHKSGQSKFMEAAVAAEHAAIERAGAAAAKRVLS
jgi:hypothetical protein